MSTTSASQQAHALPEEAFYQSPEDPKVFFCSLCQKRGGQWKQLKGNSTSITNNNILGHLNNQHPDWKTECLTPAHKEKFQQMRKDIDDANAKTKKRDREEPGTDEPVEKQMTQTRLTNKMVPRIKLDPAPDELVCRMFAALSIPFSALSLPPPMGG